MLARTPFLTADELGLTEPQHRALALTLAAFERGDLVHRRIDNTFHLDAPDNLPFTGHFNMGWWQNALPDQCGTVACIGGTAEMLGRVSFNKHNSYTLHELFYPDGDEKTYNDITPAQAAMALRNYLTTGTPNWDEALAP